MGTADFRCGQATSKRCKRGDQHDNDEDQHGDENRRLKISASSFFLFFKNTFTRYSPLVSHVALSTFTFFRNQFAYCSLSVKRFQIFRVVKSPFQRCTPSKYTHMRRVAFFFLIKTSDLLWSRPGCKVNVILKDTRKMKCLNGNHKCRKL